MPGPPPKPRATRIHWIVLALGCGTSWMLYLHRYIFALIKPKLVEEWGLGKDELGLLDSAFSTCYMLFQFPLGVFGDLAGVRWVLSGAILVWSIGLAILAWAPSVRMLAFGRATLGVGQSAAFALLSRATRNWFPATVRTTVQGGIGVFFPRMGGLCAYLLIGSLLLGIFDVNWRTAVYVCAGIGVAQAALFFLLFRNRPAQHPWVNRAERVWIEGEQGPQAERLQLRRMLRQMRPRAIVNMICLNIQSILSTVADDIYSAWIPLFLYEVHQLQFEEMGIFSALPLLGGACGGAIGGWLNDWLIARTGNRRWSRTGVGLVGKAIAAVLIFAALLSYDQPYRFCIILFFVKFFGDWSLSTLWGTVTDIGGHVTASVFAFNNAIAGIGSIAAPLIYGYVSEYHSWKTVFVIAGVAYVLCSLSWLAVNCTVPVLEEKG